MIRQIRICDVQDWFLLKPFWFFLRIFSCCCFLAFSALAMRRILSFTLDNCFFTIPQSSGISLSVYSIINWLFSLCFLLAVHMVFPFWMSAAPKWSRHTACIFLVNGCIFTLIDPFKLFRRMKNNFSSRTFHLSSFALGQLKQITFSFTLGALGR